MSYPIQFDDFIQIAGISDMEEAQILIDCGVRYVGFPLRLPVNQEDLSEEDAAAIIHAIQPGACGIAITYQSDAEEIAGLMDDLGASVIQLHGDISLGELERLKELRPTIKIIKSLVVGEREHDDLVAKARLLGPFVDAFITDTFNPSTGASGATGKTHDWRISRQLVEIAQKPVILAGGLTPENVREAILFVGPAGVDAHTGVEDASGRKDAVKVRAFVAAARAAFRLLRANTVRAG